MASWTLYPDDVIFGVYDSSDVAATANNVQAGNLTNGTPAQPYTFGTTLGGQIIGARKSASVSCVGIAICNHNLGGVSATIYNATTLLGITNIMQVNGGNSFIIPHRDFVVLTDATFGNDYCSMSFGALPSGAYIGEWSVLRSAGTITITQGGPRYPVDKTLIPGAVGIQTINGTTYKQIVGSSRTALGLQLGNLTETQRLAIEDSFADFDGWYRGIWITDTTFGDSTDQMGRGFYCEVPIGESLPGGLVMAGPLSQMRLPLIEKNKGNW